MKKRRILLALIMLIISGISLTTATYAWFTANRKVSVEEIDVKAQASGGIQISHNAQDWSNEVDVTTLRTVETNYIPTTALKPVTTIGVNGTNGKFKFFTGLLHDNGSDVKLTEVQDSENNYVAFDLYFYSAQQQSIIFNSATNIVAKNVGGSGDASDKGLKKSIRVGFLVQGTDPTATPSTALALNGGTVANQQIWEPNADVHTDYASTMLGASGVKEYYGGKVATAESGDGEYVSGTNAENFEKITIGTHHLLTSTEEAKYPSGTIFTFEPGITKVRVYVWIEGQDIDCEDTASLGTGVGVTLSFELASSGN